MVRAARTLAGRGGGAAEDGGAQQRPGIQRDRRLAEPDGRAECRAAGLRHLQVTLDAEGTPISAGDTVLYLQESANERAPVRYFTENFGGRIEADGSFRGTRWRTVMEEQVGADEPHCVESLSSAPTAEEISLLLALVAEIVRRAPSAGSNG